ncbi:unnamed protein product [Mytilus edulis]|uniref:HAT C-terminal dimerisation domain-containing protein n=1 Tax=Mytilus edulis TaxID=6550 RepID=A0A8S3Q9H1_MYTED|nr:unnamed protein product [Mytilus edulis]
MVHETDTDVNVKVHETDSDVKVHETDSDVKVHETDTDVNVKVHETDTDVNVKVHETDTDVKVHETDSDVKVHETDTDVNVKVHETDTDANVKVHETDTDVKVHETDTDITVHETDTGVNVKVHEIDIDLKEKVHETDTDTRWVSSKSRAVIALKNNLSVVAAHLESMAADNIPEAKAYHTTLVSVQFLKIMHLLFACFKEDPLSYFRIFDYARWPRDRLELARYGTEDLLKLLDIFPGIFNYEEEKERIKSQFSLLKAFLVNQNPNDMKEIYEVILAAKQERFRDIIKVIELMCCISPCTAECERGFSTMKSIKTPLRSRLEQDTLQNLMHINLSGPSVEDYNLTEI